MSRSVQLVILCEDKQHEVFARRFLAKAGWCTRVLRAEVAPHGRGSAEQFVRQRFPVELSAYRSKRLHVARALLVMLDGDDRGVDARLRELARECQTQDVDQRQDDDRVAIVVPTWNIETWLAYLSGSDVDESRGNYPRLERERDCQPHVNTLNDMCRKGKLRQPVPPSLEAACTEYSTRLQA